MSDMPTPNPDQANRKLALKLVVVAVVMVGFGFALVPLYDVFCDITGLNGKTRGQALYTAKTVDKERSIKVEFMAESARGMPWVFEPVVRSMRVHPGEQYEVTFLVRNKANEAITGQAIPSVSPGEASLYFNKTECFCFEQQLLAAGETLEMPMRFFVDTQIPESVHTITLSYRMFNISEQTDASVAKQ